MSGLAHAAPQTFTVGSLDDATGAFDCSTPTNTECTLRQAIIDANGNDGADTIVFRSGLSGDINLTDGAPEQIQEALAIAGPGAAQITVDGGDAVRTFDIDPTTAYDEVSISGLTLANGYADSSGGAIYDNDANLTISDVLVEDSTAHGNVGGGGVYTYSGDLTINSSTISGNYAGAPTTTGRGGGAYTRAGNLTVSKSTFDGNVAANYTYTYAGAYGGGMNANSGDISIDRSTINDNNARDGGGVYASSGDVTVTNSTITGNSAVSDDGGGVWVSDGRLTVTGSTVTDNYAATIGGGLQSYNDGYNTVQNSIIYGNTAALIPDTDDLGEVDELFDISFSLIGTPANHVNDVVPGSNLTGVDPDLGPLADNGGPTQTLLPGFSSPVVDQGISAGESADQRGQQRPRDLPASNAAGGDGSDMGAVEVQTTERSPESLAFGPQLVGTSSSPQTVTVSNATGGSLTLSAAALSGPNAGDFSITSDGCAGTLNVLSPCAVQVAFSPQASTGAGPKTAALEVADDESLNPLTVQLRGTATVPPAGPTPAPTAPTPKKKKKCKRHKKKHKRSAESAKKKKCKKKKKK